MTEGILVYCKLVHHNKCVEIKVSSIIVPRLVLSLFIFTKIC